MINKAKSKVNC